MVDNYPEKKHFSEALKKKFLQTFYYLFLFLKGIYYLLGHAKQHVGS